jgi:hypothetical protein
MSEKILGYNVYTTEKYVDEKLAGGDSIPKFYICK